MWFLDVSTRFNVGMMKDAVYTSAKLNPLSPYRSHLSGTILCSGEDILSSK